MSERKKLELELNKPTNLKLLFDSPIVGESQYGKYYLYAVLNGDGSTEYSYFADKDTHELLKNLNKGDEVEVTKIAAQRGKKLVTSIDVKVLTKNVVPEQPNTAPVKQEGDFYFQSMVKSFEEAMQIQERFNGMANVSQLAVTLFIQRTKNYKPTMA